MIVSSGQEFLYVLLLCSEFLLQDFHLPCSCCIQSQFSCISLSRTSSLVVGSSFFSCSLNWVISLFYVVGTVVVISSSSKSDASMKLMIGSLLWSVWGTVEFLREFLQDQFFSIFCLFSCKGDVWFFLSFLLCKAFYLLILVIFHKWCFLVFCGFFRYLTFS